MSALVIVLALGLGQPESSAARYCETRVASLPAADRDDAKARCAVVMSDFLRAHDRVGALARLAQLEAWLRLRAEPLTTPPAGDCAPAVAAKEPDLQREASERLVTGRQSLSRQHPPDDKGKARRGDLMSPF